jgi:hypothetical protein
VAQSDDAPQKTMNHEGHKVPRRSLFSGFSFVDLRALCGGRFGQSEPPPTVQAVCQKTQIRAESLIGTRKMWIWQRSFLATSFGEN